LLHKS